MLSLSIVPQIVFTHIHQSIPLHCTGFFRAELFCSRAPFSMIYYQIIFTRKYFFSFETNFCSDNMFNIIEIVVEYASTFQIKNLKNHKYLKLISTEFATNKNIGKQVAKLQYFFAKPYQKLLQFCNLFPTVQWRVILSDLSYNQ